MNNLEIILVVACAVLVVACAGGYRYLSENVRLTYKDQRVGGKR